MAEITKRVILDMDLCIECRSCSAACYYSHGEMPIVNYGITGEAQIPLICRQCSEPACVEACPNEAMHKDENGVIKRALYQCTGCGSCVAACPFGVLHPTMVRHYVGKCDLCEERVLEGEVPRCVATCPAGALQFMEESEAEKKGLLILGGRTVGRHPIRRRT